MNVARLLRLDCTVGHVAQTGAVDEMGDPTETVTSTVYKGWLWQTRRDDQTANTSIAFEEWRLALHRDAAGNVAAGDRVAVGGITYEIDGPPWEARNPRTDRLEYVEATLRRTS